MEIRIEGLKELDALLGVLPDKVANTFMIKALRKGCEPVLSAAKSEAPKGKTGALRDGLEIAREGNNMTVRTGQGNVGIQRELKKLGRAAGQAAGGGKQGYRTREGKAAWRAARKAAEAKLKVQGVQWQGQYYGGILEHGFKHGKTMVAPNRWMERALQSQAQAAIDIMAAELRAQLDADLEKAR